MLSSWVLCLVSAHWNPYGSWSLWSTKLTSNYCFHPMQSSPQWKHTSSPTGTFLFLNSVVFFYCCTLFTFQLAFILSVSLFNKVFWFIVEGCLYFVLIIGCYWKDEFHWFCGWLGALLGQTIDCQQGLCWVRIDASESSPLLFIYFCLHWLKHAIVQRLLSHWR